MTRSAAPLLAVLALLAPASCRRPTPEQQLQRSAARQSAADSQAPQPPLTEAVDDDSASPTPAAPRPPAARPRR